MKNIILITLLVSFNLKAQEWDEANSPGRFRLGGLEKYSDYKRAHQFELSTEASIEAEVDFSDGKHWSGYHYPYRHGSLYEKGNEKQNVMEKLAKANENELSFALTGLVDYLIKKNDGLDWGGNCHGYSAASLEYPEPTSKVVNGVKFTQPEIKALLAYYYNDLMESKKIIPDVIGERCKNSSQKEHHEKMEEQILKDKGQFVDPCKGVNPGAFHIALKRIIGTQKRGFVMDKDKSDHLWNVPVIAYNSQTIGEYKDTYDEKSKNASKVFHVKTVVTYLDYQKPAEDGETIMGKEGQKKNTMPLEYTIEVDDNNKIVGGKWLSSKYPDFLWYHGKSLPKPDCEGGKWKILCKLVDFDKVN